MQILPYQPIAFNLDTAEKCNTKYFLPVQKGTDSFTLQGFSAQCGHLNLIDPTAWTLGNNFSVSIDGSITYNGNLAVSSAVSNTLGLAVGQVYQVLLTVSITATQLAQPGQGVVLSINGQNMPLPAGLAAANQTFQLSWFYAPIAIGNNQLIITTNYPPIEFIVYSIEVVQYGVPALLAYDISDNYIRQLPATIHFFNAPMFNAGNATQCRFDMSFDLDTLNEGCCYLQLNDMGAGANGCQMSNWAPAAGWALSGNTATYTNDGNFNPLQQTVTLLGGQQYTFQYNLQNAQGLAFHLKVYFATGNISQLLTTSQGTFTYSFTVPGTGLQPVVLSLVPGVPLGLLTWQIAALTGHQLSVSSAILIFGQPQNNQNSNNINLRSAQSQTLLFEAANNDNAFNFNYSNALTHKIRLSSKIKYHDYGESVDQYNFSDNSNLLLSASIDKIYEITISDAAEFVHDCLSTMRLNDNFSINGQPYMADGKYTLKQRKSTQLSPAAFNVKATLGMAKNWSIS